MKKILFFAVLALLLVYGVAEATNIPMVTDPKNYPTVWTELVYNGSGDDIATGMIVRWTFEESDSDAGTIYDDMCPWVETDDDEAGPWTAGVTTIGQGITNGNVGRIIIYGPAIVHRPVQGTAVTANQNVTSDGSGYVVDETADAESEKILGVAIKSDASGNDIEAGVGASSSLIFIDPTITDN